jgi:hypothetical protein
MTEHHKKSIVLQVGWKLGKLLASSRFSKFQTANFILNYY